jgi:uncharacterized RDD family membrane protein YckC
MKKITDLTERKRRTTHLKDANGNRQKGSEEFVAKRPVKSVSSGPRFGHFIIDLIAFQIVIYIVNYVFELIMNATTFSVSVNLTIGLISGIVLLLLYPALYAFCEFKWQKTPGKFLTRTIVIDEYGNKPDLRTLILRSLLRLVPFEIFSCFGDYSHGWHDSWSKTWVVTEAEIAEIKKLQMEQSL